jgi:hypothetical protein
VPGDLPASLSLCREITDAAKTLAQVSFRQTMITSAEFRRSLLLPSGFLFCAAVFST